MILGGPGSGRKKLSEPVAEEDLLQSLTFGMNGHQRAFVEREIVRLGVTKSAYIRSLVQAEMDRSPTLEKKS